MNKLSSRLSALTLLAIALFATVLLLKDKAPAKHDSSTHSSAKTEVTTQSAALPKEAGAQIATSQPPSHAHPHTTSAPTVAQLPTIRTHNQLSKKLSASLQGAASKNVPIDTFEELRTSTVGDTVTLNIAGIEMIGTVAAIERKSSSHKFGIQLENGEGTILANFTPESAFEAQILLNDETSVFTLNSSNEDHSALLEKKSLEELYCAPKGAAYSQAIGLEGINAPVFTPTVPTPSDGQIPILNSNLGSEYVIYLDLDGESVSDPYWTIYNSFDTINAAPMTSATDVSWVTAVFQRICEDYVPFDINVTTDFAVFQAADVEKRVQCVFTSTNFIGVGTGGIAGVGSFGDDFVCWVFWDDEYYAAYAASHEVGHTLGLLHDGTSTQGYYPGHGDGETSWAPIMGNGTLLVSDPFQRPNVVQWSNGGYADADNQEDDLAIITTSNNGLTYRDDDYGDQALIADTLSVTAGSISQYGIIEQTADQDWFKFLTEGGSIVIDADIINVMSTEGQVGSATYGSDLAIELTLYDASGVQIDQSSPTDTLNASLTTNLPTGLELYYISIEGAGRKDPLTDGFSDYGSLGEYLISGTIPPAKITLFGGDDLDQLIGPGASATPSNGTAFGFVTEATSHQFTLTNTGTTAISTTAISSDAVEFTADTFTPTTLNAGESQSFNVTFDAVALRLYGATLTIDYNDGSAQTYPFAVAATKSNVGGDDNYERNNTFFQPYNLSNSPNIYLQFLLGYGIQKNNDWFQITVPSGSNQITAQCDFIHSLGNIDLLLYDQNGYLLLTEGSADDNETLSYLLPDTNGGTFFLLVKSADTNGGETDNYYDLIWNYETVAVIPPASEDNYEENDDYNEARDITNQPSLSGYLGLGTQLDNDWYKFIPTAGDNLLDLVCTFDESAGNIDILLYDARGYLIIGSNGLTGVEQIRIPISYPGDYYYVAVISGESAATGNTYDLEWETSYVTVFDDFYEENDTQATANHALDEPDVRLSDNQILGPGIQYNDDWFEFKPAADTVVMLIHAEFPDAVGAINIAAYDSNQNLISNGVTTDADTFVNIEVHGRSSFFLKVTGDDIGDTYDLYYENLTEDKYEPNNSAGTATDLTTFNGTPLSQIKGSGIQNNDDWYQYDVPSGSGSLTVDASFSHAEGDIDMALVGPDNTQVGLSLGVDDTEQIVILPILPETTIPEGVYALRLYGFAGNHKSAYDLAFTVQEPPAQPAPAPEDNYEINNTYSTPSTVLSAASQRGVLLSTVDGLGTQLNADWYQISVPSGENLVTVQCDFTHYAEGDINMALYTSAGARKATSATSSDNESITYLAPSGGTYLILIYGVDAGITYDLSWTSVAPPAEDAYEPSTFSNPTNINSQENSWLSLLNGPGVQYNEDWYSFTTTGQNVIELTCQFTHSEQHDLRMVLYRNGYNVAEVDSSDDNETITYTDTTGGNATYKVLIDGSNFGTIYDLQWIATPVDTTPPTEDNYEDNDDYFEAYNLSSYEGIWLSAIDGNGVKIDNDNDWYVITVPAGNFFLTIDTAYVNFDYEVYLRDKDGRMLYSWFGGGAGIALPNVNGDTFYIQIVSVFNGTEYDIKWDAIAATIDADSDQLSDAWELAHGLSISAINTDENPDSDNYPNWAEYTLNLDPNVFSSNVVRQYQKNNYTYIQFIQRKDAIESGYSVTVKESATLSFSNDEAEWVSTETSPDDAATDIVTYRCSASLTEAPTCFFMLEINKPD